MLLVWLMCFSVYIIGVTDNEVVVVVNVDVDGVIDVIYVVCVADVVM